MNAYNLICGAIHSAGGQFSDFWRFAGLIKQRYGDLPYDHAVVSASLRQDTVHRGPHGLVDDQQALEILIARDLARARAEIGKVPPLSEFTQQLETTLDSAMTVLREVGIQMPVPPLFVVERFPEPYDRMDWVAFAPDMADQESYGIESGIYLLESELAPFYSELTLAHELIHVAIGAVNPRLLGRGLEEGLAELVGGLHIGSQLCSSRIARNVFIHTRLGNASSQSNSLYLDYARQALLVYLRLGFAGLADVIRGGRETVKQVEACYLAGDLESLHLSRGRWDDSSTRLFESVLLGLIPNLVVSPLAAYVAEFAVVGKTVEQVAMAANADASAVRNALVELQDRTFTLLLDRDRIVYSDLPFIIDSGSLRYEVMQ